MSFQLGESIMVTYISKLANVPERNVSRLLLLMILTTWFVVRNRKSIRALYEPNCKFAVQVSYDFRVKLNPCPYALKILI